MNIELKCNFPQCYSFCVVFLYLIYSELSFCDEIFQKILQENLDICRWLCYLCTRFQGLGMYPSVT